MTRHGRTRTNSATGEERGKRTRAAAAVAGAAAAIVVVSLTLRAPDAARALTDPASGIELVLIDPATFRMGTPLGEAGREAQEVPHDVHLSRPYYLGRYEVTQAQWQRVMHTNPSHFQPCDSCPVERVTLHDVERFLTALNARGGGFRLPTEAEWEYACRAGGTEPFGHSSSLGSADANIDGRFPYAAPVAPVRGRTTAVGQFAPNPFGLYDMQGNVWEWTADWYCLYADGAVTDPRGTCASEYRVIRGGSWTFDGNSARCGLRYTHRPQDSGYSLGVRVAKDAR